MDIRIYMGPIGIKGDSKGGSKDLEGGREIGQKVRLLMNISLWSPPYLTRPPSASPTVIQRCPRSRGLIPLPYETPPSPLPATIIYSGLRPDLVRVKVYTRAIDKALASRRELSTHADV
jgi:hypothetical protein